VIGDKLAFIPLRKRFNKKLDIAVIQAGSRFRPIDTNLLEVPTDLSENRVLERPRPSPTAFAILGETVTRSFRSSKGPDVGDILYSIEALSAFAHTHGPGCLNVDEHSLDPFAGLNNSAKSCGRVIQQPGGRCVVDPVP